MERFTISLDESLAKDFVPFANAFAEVKISQAKPSRASSAEP